MRPVDGRTLARAATAAVALLALGVAVALYRDAAADPAALWRDPFHDRNSHLRTGLEIALALRHGDLAAAFAAATGTLVWPPLHGLLLGLVFLAGGPRLELAILPSLLGWWATILGTWVLAWRSAGPGQPAWMAGLVAAGLALLSPAFRLLGTDVMLEGLGAGLSAWALVAGQRCLERPDRARGRLLGLLLTLLFLEKYNYWLMVAAALAATVLLSPRLRPPALAALLALARPAVAALPRVPLLPLGLAVVAAALLLPAAPTLAVAGRTLTLDPLGQILPVGYGLLLLGIAWWWRRAGSGLALPGALRALLGWHAVPVALWLLQPWAIASLVRFLAQGQPGGGAYAPWRAVAGGWTGFAEGFHAAPWLGGLALGLAALGAAALARREPGPRLVMVMAILSAAAVLLHPHQQWRFQATGLFALWSCAGVGAAALAGRLRRRLPPLPAAALALGAVAAALAAALAEPPSPIAAAAAIRTPAAPSDLALAEALQALLPGEAATGLAGPGRSDLYPWALALGCRCRVPVDQPDLTAAGSPQAARAMVAAWLAASPADRIVAVDPPAAHALPGAVGWEDRRRAIAEALAAQDLFRPAAAAVAPDGTRLQLYLRRPDAPRPPAPRRLHLLDGLALLLGLAVVVLLLLPARRPAPGRAS